MTPAGGTNEFPHVGPLAQTTGALILDFSCPLAGPLSASRRGVIGRSSVRGVLLPGPPDGVPHVGCVLRTPSAEHLEVDILLESLEQPLPAAQHERRGGDRSSSTTPA